MTTDNPASSEHPSISAPVERLPRLAHPLAYRFRIVLVILGAVALAAVAIAIATAVGANGSSRPGRAPSGHWSSWAPDSSGGTGVSEIADYVALYYRSSPSQQLDAVTPISVAQATAAGTTTGSGLTISVSQGTSASNQSLALLSGRTVAYNICGLGPRDCDLAGTPSVYRMLLMRREALELALYTFRYIGGSDNVLAVLPPSRALKTGSTGSSTSPTSSGSAAKVTVAVLFTRAELQPWLQAPLNRTLQQYPPGLTELPAWGQTDEAGLVDQITAHGLFSSRVESQQEGGSLLVLTPLPAQ